MVSSLVSNDRMSITQSDKKLIDHQILIFDVYGTLCDWETGLYNALQPLLKAYPSTTSTWTRMDALTAFSSVEGNLQAQLPGMTYRELLARVYATLEARLKAQEEQSRNSSGAVQLSLSNQGSHEEGPSSPPSRTLEESAAISFAESIRSWPIFQDSSSALARLAKHFKLVVLSNVDNDSFGWTHKLLSLGSTQETESDPGLYSYPIPNPNKFWHPQEISGSKSPFTAILTAQDVGCYKPSLKGFRTVLDYVQSQPELFGITDVGELSQDQLKGKILCVAQSLRHDIEPANALGLHTVWIDRQSAATCNEAGEGKPGWGKWTWRFESLGAMAEAVEKEIGRCV